MSATYLLLRFDAQLMSFGAAQGNRPMHADDFVSQVPGRPPGCGFLPGRPMLTGLIGNAFGFERWEGDRLQALSERVRFAAALPREPQLDVEFCTAQLEHDDRGWTTRGRVEGRRGGPGTYENAHLRRKLSWLDADAAVAVRLHGDEQDTHDLAEALRRPARPLFLGRKAYLPSAPIFHRIVEASTAYEALARMMPAPWGAVWDLGEGPDDAPIVERDDRGWLTGVYQGSYRMHFHLPAPFGEDHV